MGVLRTALYCRLSKDDILKESGASRGTSERPSIEARLQGYRAQVRKPSAPAREKAKSVAKSRPKTR